MYKHLVREQRYAIGLMLKEKKSKKEIAEAIGCSESTVCREIRRNSSKRGYNYAIAQEVSEYRKERSPGNHAIKEEVWKLVLKFLVEEQWSPEQISGYLANRGISISHETIYKRIRRDKAEGGCLYRQCRHKLKHRKRPVGKHIPIPNRISIHERPPEADGTRFGDWEMDTIVGANNEGAIVTLTERSVNFMMMKKLPFGKDSKRLADAVVELLFPYMHSIRSITTDNGTEFADHQSISRRLGGVPIFFADPFSSWQKGSIENINMLARQYIPKGSDFKYISDDFISAVQYKINRRPRKKLNFLSPKEAFFNLII